MSTSDVLIIDEVDHFILRQPSEIRNLILGCTTIGFTATAFDDRYSQIQQQVYSDLGFRVIDFWPREIPKPAKACIDKKLTPMDVDQLIKFI